MISRLRVLLLASGLAAVEAPRVLGQSPELTTTGSATVSLTPTRATVALTVATRGASAASAANDNSEKVRTVLAALQKRAGLLDSLRVTRIDVSPQQNYETHEIVGYEAEARLEGVVRDLDRVGDILDVGLGAGASSIAGVYYRSDSLEAGRSQALAAAYTSAHAAALSLAKAAGRRLGPLLSLSNAVPNLGGYQLDELRQSVVYGYISGDPSRINPSPGGVQVQATVVAKWQLE